MSDELGAENISCELRDGEGGSGEMVKVEKIGK